MYLKRLEILGFKSFANKTKVDFASGVTAIVGPNGCGKTNILDALRWVLGEQKVTLLRGGKMEEVIFNGSRDLKPLGMSEVSLSVVNNRGILPTEYSEVQVTRRLFRSGESEYLLNKVPCRLKDILDLFADTGMGAHSYSVIQQDMVEAILSNKAEERRFLFEEASGITKYKQRKKAALRKLEATEHDFLRLKDIHAEVRTQVNSLYRQHKKAERYQTVVDDIRQWELYLGSARIRKLDTDKREFQGRLDNLSGQRHEQDTQLNQIGAELEGRRKEQIDIERQLSDVGNTIYEITEKAHSIERDISVSREKKSNAANLIEKNEADIVTLNERRDVLAGQAAHTRELLAGHQEALEQVTAQFAEAEKEQGEADRRLLAARQAKEDENRKLIDLEGKISSGRTEGNSLREQETELTDLIAHIDTQITENKPQQSTLLVETEKYQRELDDMLGNKKQTIARQNEIKNEMETLVERSEETAEEISTLTASIEACEARRSLLEDMMLHFEGHGAGLVAVMEERHRWPGILGTVADLFVPVDGMEDALEAALGDLATCLVCSNRQTAHEIIDFVRAEDKGRIGILVPDSGGLNPAVKRPVLEAEGFVGWLDSLVSVDEPLAFLKEAVLAHTAVVREATSPDTVLPHLPHGFSMVSTEGITYKGNFISGGAQEHFPLFRRREKIEEEQATISELGEKLARAREERSQCIARLGALRAESGELVSKLDTCNEEIERLQKRVGELDFERRTLTAEFERLDKERRTLQTKLETIRSRQTSLVLDFGQLTNLKDELIDSMQQVGSRLSEFETAASAANERVSRLQVKIIETRSQVDQAENQIAHTSEIQQDLEQTLSTRRREIEEARTEITTCENRIAECEESLKSIFGEREKLTERQSTLRTAQAEIMEQVNAHEERLKDIRDGKDTIGEELHQLEIRVNTINNEVKAIRDRVLEDYDLDVLTLEANRPEADFSDEDAGTHLQEQKEKLKKFGAVNLLALEEYRTAAEREKFLSEQITDLQSAKTDLQSTISRINVTARELFMDTFNKVQGHFKNLFIELFSGGEAEIRLTDPTDPLESAIEIIARPRGKKLISIAQMSGGERALTAISLLFSLYLVKPSPFCILDEIDAPLDDANCHRFLKMIRTFSRQTQFVVITHNKITMEAADNLYGVTMENPGVSTLVAVRFNDSGDIVSGQSEEAPSENQTMLEGSEDLPDSIKERITPNVTIHTDEETTT